MRPVRAIPFVSTTAVFLFAWTIALGATPARADGPAAIVIGIKGTWSADGVPLVIGSLLSDGATVAGASSNDAGDIIWVKFYGALNAKDPRSLISCSPAAACATGWRIDGRTVDGKSRRLQDAALSIFVRRRTFGYGRVRGVSEEQLADGVAPIAGKRLSLGSIAATVDPGTYDVIVTRGAAPQSPNSAARSTVVRLTIDTAHPAAVASVLWPNAVPGLYRIHLERPGDATDPLGDDAIVLVTAEEKYATIHDAYERMAASMGPVDPSLRSDDPSHAFLRATLEALEATM